MRKPTIGDVAKAANVSPATVDRALNGRGGVSRGALLRISKAARDLGYGTLQDRLTEMTRPKADICLIMPKSEFGFVADLRQFVRAQCESIDNLDINLNVRCVQMRPEPLVQQLECARATKPHAIALFAYDLPEIRELINKCVADGIKVVTMVSDVPSSARHCYVGIDNYAAGRTGARLMGKFLSGTRGKVLVLTGSMSIRDHMERFFGFREVLLTSYPNLTVLPARETDNQVCTSFDAIVETSKQHSDLVGIYLVTGGARAVLSGVRECQLPKKPILITHDLTSVSRNGLVSGEIDAIVHQSAEMIAQEVVSAAISDLLPETETSTRAEVPIPISIFVLDNIPG